MSKELIEKIHDIIGTMDYPELRDIKTQRIILLIAKTMNSMLYENAECSAFCVGFARYNDIIADLMEEAEKINAIQS